MGTAPPRQLQVSQKKPAAGHSQIKNHNKNRPKNRGRLSIQLDYFFS